MSIVRVARASWKRTGLGDLIQLSLVTSPQETSMLIAKIEQTLANTKAQVYPLNREEYNRYCYCLDEWLAWYEERGD